MMLRRTGIGCKGHASSVRATALSGRPKTELVKQRLVLSCLWGCGRRRTRGSRHGRDRIDRVRRYACGGARVWLAEGRMATVPERIVSVLAPFMLLPSESPSPRTLVGI